MRNTPASPPANLELITIYEISKILSSSLDFSKTIQDVLNVLLSHLHMHHGVASMVQESGQLHVVGASGTARELDKFIELDVAESIWGKVFKGGMPVVVPDISQDTIFARHGGAKTRNCAGVAFIGVPIRSGRECLGVLSVDRHPGGDRPINFERDVRILSLVANLIGQTWKLHQSVAHERSLLIEEKQRLQKQLQKDHDIENIVGKSRRIKQVFAEVHQAAPGKATVLLRGESGTGKEAIAHAIHYLSPRAKGPFIKVNCASLPETLLESELFGHEKGAFTGAMTERRGRFEMADKGTLFLDEIGDTSLSFQAKLLRVLQEHEFERIGSNKTLRTEFRLVCATNRNLEEMVTKNEFRADLYFRINVVAILLPPLRERKEDIPLLVDFFLGRFNRENGRALTMSAEALQVFARCNWPGNVRELENCVERAATMCRGNVIEGLDMRCQKGQCFSSLLLETTARSSFPIVAQQRTHAPTMPAPEANDAEDQVATMPSLTLTERERMLDAMEKCGWVQAKAARMLNLTPRQMSYALKKYGIEVKHF
ncbi:MAG: nif-specific transcriptional activator NifA [Betaproteobacteria bacterium]|nr:nif-specific transcriptional activator NifA [Betaproteobacteria bacterium]